MMEVIEELLNQLEITRIDNIYVCNNCGANDTNPFAIIHFHNCHKGESKKWEEYYNIVEDNK